MNKSTRFVCFDKTQLFATLTIGVMFTPSDKDHVCRVDFIPNFTRFTRIIIIPESIEWCFSVLWSDFIEWRYPSSYSRGLSGFWIFRNTKFINILLLLLETNFLWINFLNVWWHDSACHFFCVKNFNRITNKKYIKIFFSEFFLRPVNFCTTTILFLPHLVFVSLLFKFTEKSKRNIEKVQ